MEEKNFEIKTQIGNGKECVFSIPEGTIFNTAFIAAFYTAHHILEEEKKQREKKAMDELEKIKEEEAIVLGDESPAGE